MKTLKPAIAACMTCAFVFALSHQSQRNQDLDKPTESWLARPHQVVTNPDGVIRTRLQALDFARLHLKYLFGTDNETVEVERVGQYWVGYTRLPKSGNVPILGETYFVKINPLNGGAEEYGLFP